MKMESSSPLVSIITVNYNSTEVTVELLRSIQRLSNPLLEVIVVDNASREDPGDRLRAVDPEVKVISERGRIWVFRGAIIWGSGRRGESIFSWSTMIRSLRRG
jgi:GT2 family glycosyltransferase